MINKININIKKQLHPATAKSGCTRLAGVLVLCGVLGACSALPRSVDADGREVQEPERALRGELVRNMLDQGQYYAALAHIQQLQRDSGNSAELRYLEAEAQRRLGQTAKAEALYRGLLRTGYAADAYHGLGLLYAKTDLNAAVQQLQQAVQRRPTDIQMRNDLGYALMVGRRYREALPQLATAVELDPEGEKSLNNLILLLLLTGDEAGVKRVAAQGAVSSQTLAGLRKQAQSMTQGRGKK